jgi:mRNA-degrading endonuclease toxin of MazEF toxin-antitoxin module
LSGASYPKGSVVMVPFPFTDLSGRKRRPALVVSPERFHEEDLILCAITSRVPERLSEWEVPLAAGDMTEEELPKESVVKVGKLFTTHRSLIADRFGAVKEEKLQEVLGKLRGLFADDEAAVAGPEATRDEDELRTEDVDEAVLAHLHLNAFEDREIVRAWKTFDWETMDRLHERGLISDPKSKAKSVILTEKGRRAAEEAFRKLFAS